MARFKVSGDGMGVVSHAGTALVQEPATSSAPPEAAT
jgi:hypothetical protein